MKNYELDSLFISGKDNDEQLKKLYSEGWRIVGAVGGLSGTRFFMEREKVKFNADWVRRLFERRIDNILEKSTELEPYCLEKLKRLVDESDGTTSGICLGLNFPDSDLKFLRELGFTVINSNKGTLVSW